MSSWSFCENCTFVDDYNDKCRLCNQCQLHRGHTCKIKTLIRVLKRYVTHTRGFLCSSCHYDKSGQWENAYPDMIAKKPKGDFGLFLRDWYRLGFELLWEEEPR